MTRKVFFIALSVLASGYVFAQEHGVEVAEATEETPSARTFFNPKSKHYEPLAVKFLERVYERYPEYKADIEKALKDTKVSFVDSVGDRSPEIKASRGVLTVDTSRFNKSLDEVTRAKWLLGEILNATWNTDAGYQVSWRMNANFNVSVSADTERSERAKALKK
jgi:hypothetical protein